MAQKKEDLPLPASLQGPFLGEISTVYPGRLDSTNQFLPAVGLDTSEKRQDGAHCSGVLLSPRLVLTAGHCVCLRRKVVGADRPKIKTAVERTLASQPARVKAAMVRKTLRAADTIIDGTRCARLSMVIVTTYLSKDGEVPNRQRNGRVAVFNEQYRGELLRPHPDFMIIQDEKESIFKESDLAIVVLSEPVEEAIPPVKLPRTAVRRGEPVVMAGFGYGSTKQSSRAFGDRHVAESVVVALMGSDSPDVQFAAREEPGDGGVPAGIYAGDSGGPCFSKSDKELLLGIATGITTENERQKLSIFTSVYPARDWVRRVAQEMGETVQ